MPYELIARCGSPNVWVETDYPGQPDLGPFLLPDGRNIYTLVENGEVEDLDFVPRFIKTKGSRFGDILWTTSSTKIVSQRFIDALSGFSDWKSFPVEIHDRRGKKFDGFLGFAVLGDSQDVFHTVGHQSEHFGVSDQVMEVLRSHDVNQFKSKRIPPRKPKL